MTDDDDFLIELTNDFIEQVVFSLEECEEAFLSLEDAEDKSEQLTTIFRLAHSIKGGAAVIGLTKLTDFAHKVEDLLSLLRENPSLVNAKVISILLTSVDAFKERIELLKNGANDDEWDIVEIEKQIVQQIQDLDNQPIEIKMDTHDIEIVQPAASQKIEMSATAPQTMEPPVKELQKQPVAASTKNNVNLMKVDTKRVDNVLNLVGEIVILKSQLLRESNKSQSHDQMHLVEQLDSIVRELYDRSLSLRMTPLKPLFLKVQRIVRDVSIKLSKPIDLKISGESTELDRTMLDVLSDPFIHISRNAIDHGIESEADRLAAGKPAIAQVQFRAYQEGGIVVVEFEDDGGGISPQKVLNKALSANLLTSDEAEHLTEEQIINLIFEPGFSTSEVISDLSGRGVGLDVAKSNIEKIKGTIRVESKLGVGTKFIIEIPLTTAILDGMVVGNGGEIYILPLLNVKELLRYSDAFINEANSINRTLCLRDHYMPIFYLSELIEGGSKQIDLKIEPNDTVIILEYKNKEIAVVVDRVYEQGQFVVKPLGGVKSNVTISGGSILGDGRVALICDIQGFFKVFSKLQKVDKHLNVQKEAHHGYEAS